MPNNTGLDVNRLMAKVPCKEDAIFKNSSFRKAVSRYVRCYSQVGWIHTWTHTHTLTHTQTFTHLHSHLM